MTKALQDFYLPPHPWSSSSFISVTSIGKERDWEWLTLQARAVGSVYSLRAFLSDDIKA